MKTPLKKCLEHNYQAHKSKICKIKRKQVFLLATDGKRLLDSIVQNVEKVIVGKKSSIELAIVALICDGHVLVEDVPGVGKTGMVSALAKSIDSTFKRIQFTPDVLPSDITGFSIYNQKNSEFEYRHGVVMANFILADEINRTPPKTQASLLEAMEERQVTVDGNTYNLPRPFMVMATQNPVEYLGTFPLPEAQIDRFLIRIAMGYPTSEDESKILERNLRERPIDKISPVANASDIVKIQQQVKEVHIDRSVNEYIVDIIGKTRTHNDVALGASIRGTLNLGRASQAYAYYSGRTFITPDDVKKMAEPVLSHRLMLKQEAKLKKINPQIIIRSIIDSVKVPVVDRYVEK